MAAAAGEAFRAQERAVSCSACAEAEGIILQNGSCQDVSLSCWYVMGGGQTCESPRQWSKGAGAGPKPDPGCCACGTEAAVVVLT